MEQKSFVPKESPSRRAQMTPSPQRQFRKKNSPISSALLEDIHAESINVFDSTDDVNLALDSWEVEKADRERRKSDIREKLQRIQSGLATISSDESKAKINGSCEDTLPAVDTDGVGVVQVPCEIGDDVNEHSPHDEYAAPTEIAPVLAGSGDIRMMSGDDDGGGGNVVVGPEIIAEIDCSDITGGIKIDSGVADVNDIIASVIESLPERKAVVKRLVPNLHATGSSGRLDALEWDEHEEEDCENHDAVDDLEAEQQVSDGVREEHHVNPPDNVVGDITDEKLIEDNMNTLSVDDKLLELEAADKVIFPDFEVTEARLASAGASVRQSSSGSIDRQASASTASSSTDPSIATGPTAIGTFPSISGEMTRQSVDMDPTSMGGMLPPYVGNSDYSQFGVIENLELYMREQVFSSNRPSFPSPYILSTDIGPMKDMIPYVSPPPYTERFVSVYREKVFVANNTSDLSYDGNYTSLKCGDRDTTSLALSKELNAPDMIVSTPYHILVATDMFLYVLKDFPSLNRMTKAPYLFGDAPIPILVRVHPLQCFRYASFFQF